MKPTCWKTKNRGKVTASNAVSNKNYKRARDLLAPLAERGHPGANSLLANLSFNGLGQSTDYMAAFKYATVASEGGDPKGSFWLMQAYLRGMGVQQDITRANDIRFNAAKQMTSWALAGLGVSYLQGQGVAIDYEKARQYLVRAAMQSHPDGLLGMGMIYENGWGTAQDRERAILWYERTAESGNESAAQIANQRLRSLRGGNGNEPNPIKLIGDVIKLFRK